MEMGIPLNTDSTLPGQIMFLSERTSELMQENIITDRTIIDVMAFAKCSESMYYFEADDFCNFASHMLDEYDYIFYVSPEGVESVDKCSADPVFCTQWIIQGSVFEKRLRHRISILFNLPISGYHIDIR